MKESEKNITKMKESEKNTKKFKRNLPFSFITINAFAIGIGIVLFIVAFAIYQKNVSYNGLIQVLMSIGAGLISAVLINILYEIRSQNPVLKMIMDASRESWNTINKIRDDQSVNIKFSKKNDKLIAKITHEFQYIGITRQSYKAEIAIFSDFRGEAPKKEELNNANYYPAFYFEKISLNNLPVKKWNQISDRGDLCNVINGRIFYSQDIDMPSKGGQSKKLKFEIHNTYDINDKLVWTFQELSEDAVINIEIDNSFKELDFFLRLNHPLAKDIIQKNIQSVAIDSKTGKLTEDNISLRIHEKILPFQGFEMHWNQKSPK